MKRTLTFHVQRHRAALAVSFLIAAHARVDSRATSGHFLQHQRLIADNHAGTRIVVQQLSLRATNTNDALLVSRYRFGRTEFGRYCGRFDEERRRIPTSNPERFATLKTAFALTFRTQERY